MATFNNMTITSVETSPFGGFDEHVVFDAVQRALDVLGFLVSLTGVITNFITIVTFMKIGIKDSVTICFFCLTLSDILVCFFEFGKSTNELVDGILLALNLVFPENILPVLFIFLRKMWQHNTIIVTTFLAIQRCLCVLLPLKVKSIFNKTRTSLIMTFIFLYNISVGITHICTIVSAVEDPITNSTVFVTSMKNSGPFEFFATDIQTYIFRTVIPTAMVISVVVMAAALKKSAQFHQRVTGKGINTSDSKSTQKEQSKERKAILQVTVVSFIFIVTNIPILIVSLVQLASPDFSMGGKNRFLYQLFISLCSIAEVLNSSVNFFVYYSLNSKFKQCLTSWCTTFHKAT